MDASGVVYQWRFNGTNIAGATNDSLLLLNVTAANQGSYSVVVSNSFGSVTSSVAQLYIDSVGAGIPDSWAISNFGTTNIEALGDSDGDGVANVVEFQDGTNPNSKNSADWRLTVETDGGGSVSVSPFLNSYTNGQIVTLIATPNTNGQFYAWSGGITTNLKVLSVVMGSNTALFAHFLSPAPPPGMVGWWQGESNALDILGLNNGTFTGTPAYGPGMVGTGFLFNGSNASVSIADTPSLRPASLTLEAWAYFNALNGNRVIFAKPVGSGTLDAFTLFYNGVYLVGEVDSATTRSANVTLGMTPTLGKWYHFAYTYDDASKAEALYVNGVVAATNKATAGISPGYDSQPVLIGRDTEAGNPSYFFSGGIDEASIYNRALTSNEIAAIYQSGKSRVMPYLTNSPALPGATLGIAFTQQFGAVLGTGASTYSVSSGTLPAGLSLNSAGLLNGTPQQAGNFSFGISATDSAGNFREQIFSLGVITPLAPAMPAGLISWWRAESNTADFIGTNNGIFTNGPSYAAGEVGQAFNFNGSNQTVMIPDSLSLRPASVTLESWVSLNTFTGVFFGKQVGLGALDSYAIWYDGVNLNAFICSASTNGPILSAPYSPSYAAWFHVAYTFDDSTKQQALYLNGSLVASGYAPLSIGYSAFPLTLGCDETSQTFGGFVNGKMDEAAIYGRALNSNEVAAIYNAGVLGKLTNGPYFNTLSNLPGGVVGQSYSQPIVTVESSAPVTFSMDSGTLPPGISLSSAGILSGIPTSPGSFAFVIRAIDHNFAQGTQLFTLNVIAPLPPPEGVISWWRAEGNTTDAIGTNNGTLTNATFGAGKVGQAFEFSGNASYLSIPDSGSLRPASITLEAWVLFFTASGQQGVFSKPFASGIFDSYTLYLNNSNLSSAISDSNQVASSLSVPFVPVAGQWYHVAFTHDATTTGETLYLNGVPVASGVANRQIAYDSHPILIGSDIDNGSFVLYFNGRIDEAAVYNRALSSNEVAAIYGAGVAGKTVAGPFFATAPTLTNAIVGQVYSNQINSVRGTAPLTFGITSGSLPPGLGLSTSGLLSGTPTTNGNFTFTIQVTDSVGLFATQTCNLMTFTPVPEAPGMISWWRAEGNALDSAGTNNGTLMNGATFATGEVGQSFLFNGTNQYVTIPDSPGLRPSSVTLEAWVRFNASSGYTQIMGKPVGSGVWDSYTLYLNAGALNGAVCTVGGPGPILSASFSPGLGSWYHLAYTFDQTTLNQALYINGVVVASGIGDRAPGYDTHAVLIGADNDNGTVDGFFPGQIDEPAIYNRALTPSEIAGIYNAGAAGRFKNGPVFTTSPTLPYAIVGQAYSQTCSVTNSNGAVNYSLSGGTLPAGLSLASVGTLSGIPAQSGTYNFTVTATDSSSLSVTQQFTLFVYNSVTPPAGLVSWWRAEGNALDSIGTNNGVLANGASFAPGIAGQSFSLNGTNQSIDIPDSPSLRPASVSVEGWVVFYATNGIQQICGKAYGFGVLNSFALWLDAAGNLNGEISDASGAAVISAAFNPTIGQWYHVGFAFDDNLHTEALYINGSQVAAGGGLRTIAYDTNKFTIGRATSTGAGIDYLDGRIDELAIYNRALTGPEMDAVFSAGPGGKAVFGPFFLNGQSLTNGFLGASYNQSITTSRGSVPVLLSVLQGQLPPGLSLSSAGLVSGTPRTSGIFQFIIQATDASGLTATQSFTINVYRQTPVAPGLVAWWKGDDNLIDSAGTNNGIFMGPPAYSSGIFGDAFSLNGTNSYIRITDSSALRPDSFTLQCFAQFNSSVGNQGLISKPLGTALSDSFILYLNGGLLVGDSISSTFNYNHITCPFMPTVGRWYRLGYSYNSFTGQQALYVDGVQVADQIGATATTLTARYDTNTVLLGADIDNGAADLFFGGRLDEVTIHNRELTPDEVAMFWTIDVPSLSITSAGPNLFKVSWPATGSFTLQLNSDLSTANWITSGYEITNILGTNSVTISPDSSSMFFRLKQ